jgi:broad specificity phosphatase PhoE
VPIYLIRHGESAGNAAHTYQGRQDTALTPRGEAQALALGRWLKRQGLACDAVYASPLQRATRTAQLATAEAGFPAPQPEPLLQEFHVGELQGLPVEAIDARWPGFSSRPLESRGDFSAFGGESYEDVQQRLGQFIARIQAQYTPQHSVLAFSHGGAISQLLKLWCGWPVPRHFFTRMSNCCCYKLGLLQVDGRHLAQLEWMVPLELIEQQP